MPNVLMKTKVHRDGGPQYHVYDAAILRKLALTSTHWSILVIRPDGEYHDPQLTLVMKEYGYVGHDRVQTGGRHIPNLIEAALKLYGLEDEVDISQIRRLYFDIDTYDDATTTVYISPRSFEQTGEILFPIPASLTKKEKPSSRTPGRLLKIPSLDKHTERVRHRREYRVPAEKRVDQHLVVVDRLRQQLLAQGLEARGSYRDIDVHTKHAKRDFVFEVKTGQDIKAKARNAIGQLMEYEYLYRHRMPDPYLCVVIDQEPGGHLAEFLEYAGIGICWTTESGFDCAPFCWDDLSFLRE